MTHRQRRISWIAVGFSIHSRCDSQVLSGSEAKRSDCKRSWRRPSSRTRSIRVWQLLERQIFGGWGSSLPWPDFEAEGEGEGGKAWQIHGPLYRGLELLLFRRFGGVGPRSSKSELLGSSSSSSSVGRSLWTRSSTACGGENLESGVYCDIAAALRGFLLGLPSLLGLPLFVGLALPGRSSGQNWSTHQFPGFLTGCGISLPSSTKRRYLSIRVPKNTRSCGKMARANAARIYSGLTL